MNERIRKLRKELDLTQREFGERIGIKGNTIAQYELGRNEPIDAVVSLICREFNVSEAWLRTGEGEMFVQSDNDVFAQLARDHHLEDYELAVIEEFVKLNKSARATVMEYYAKVAVALGADPSIIQHVQDHLRGSAADKAAEAAEQQKTAAAEAAYRQDSHRAGNTDGSASSTTADDGLQRAN